MMKKAINDNLAGGLLLLFLLLAVHLLCSLAGSGPGAAIYNWDGDIKGRDLPMTAFQKITLGMPISINREGLEGLTAVPGIGPGIARSIIRERSKRNGFKRLDEVKTIKGIGPGLYKRIKSYLIL